MTKQGKNNHIAISLILFMMLYPDLSGQIEFTYQSDYYYVKGKDATSLPGTWMNPGYDYSGWTKGQSSFQIWKRSRRYRAFRHAEQLYHSLSAIDL